MVRQQVDTRPPQAQARQRTALRCRSEGGQGVEEPKARQKVIAPAAHNHTRSPGDSTLSVILLWSYGWSCRRSYGWSCRWSCAWAWDAPPEPPRAEEWFRDN